MRSLISSPLVATIGHKLITITIWGMGRGVILYQKNQVVASNQSSSKPYCTKEVNQMH